MRWIFSLKACQLWIGRMLPDLNTEVVHTIKFWILATETDFILKCVSVLKLSIFAGLILEQIFELKKD